MFKSWGILIGKPCLPLETQLKHVFDNEYKIWFHNNNKGTSKFLGLKINIKADGVSYIWTFWSKNKCFHAGNRNNGDWFFEISRFIFLSLPKIYSFAQCKSQDSSLESQR